MIYGMPMICLQAWGATNKEGNLSKSGATKFEILWDTTTKHMSFG
jgi:hypothetical protein